MKFIFIGILLPLLNLSASEEPKWVNSPIEYCGKEKLCAVGEASGRMMAEAEARNALAKIFETKIKSTTSATTNSESTIKDDVVSGKVDEYFNSQIKEITEQTLEGVEVEKFFEGSESFYALATLDKRKAAKRLVEKMKEIDVEIYDLYTQNKRSTINKALQLNKIRENLNSRHYFLVERNYNSKVSKQDILKLKSLKRQRNVVIFFKVKELSETNEFKNYVIEKLLDNDLKVVTVPTLPHQYVVEASLIAERQHMNVKGFEKYKFLINFEAKTLKGKKIGELNYDHITTGRNLTQAYSNATTKLKTYINENIGLLNID